MTSAAVSPSTTSTAIARPRPSRRRRRRPGGRRVGLEVEQVRHTRSLTTDTPLYLQGHPPTAASCRPVAEGHCIALRRRRRPAGARGRRLVDHCPAAPGRSPRRAGPRWRSRSSAARRRGAPRPPRPGPERSTHARPLGGRARERPDSDVGRPTTTSTASRSATSSATRSCPGAGTVSTGEARPGAGRWPPLRPGRCRRRPPARPGDAISRSPPEPALLTSRKRPRGSPPRWCRRPAPRRPCRRPRRRRPPRPARRPSPPPAPAAVFATTTSAAPFSAATATTRRALPVDPAADVLGEPAHWLPAGAVRRLMVDVRHPEDIALRRPARPGARCQHLPGAHLLQLLLDVTEPGEDPPNALGDLLGGGPDHSASRDEQVLPGEEAVRVVPTRASTRRTPEPTDASRGASRGRAGPSVPVRSAAQLPRLVAHLDDPDRVAVLLAEQRHRPEATASSWVMTKACTCRSASQLVDQLLDVAQNRLPARRPGLWKSKRKGPEPFSEPAWVAVSPSASRKALCTMCVAVCAREIARLRSMSTMAWAPRPVTASPAMTLPRCTITPPGTGCCTS